jgi:hypothetical protein
MISSILAIEDPIFNWVFDHIPTIGTIIILILAAVWITWRVTRVFGYFENRLVKVENAVIELQADMKSVKRRLTRMEKKLDKLITYLTTTKQVDKDVLK